MKSALRLRQEEFLVAVSKLISYADYKDIGLTLGDGYRDERVHGKFGTKMGYGHERSVHKVRLAIDLLTSDPKDTKDHEVLHDYWDTLGGARRIPNDLNHYSFEYQGMR